MNKNNNENNTFEKVSVLFNNLLKHTEQLCELAKDISVAKENKEKIIELGVWHVLTRNIAKDLVEKELPVCKGTFAFSMVKKNLMEQIIIMTNLATQYQEHIEKALIDENDEKLEYCISELKEYSIETKKMGNMLTKMIKFI